MSWMRFGTTFIFVDDDKEPTVSVTTVEPEIVVDTVIDPDYDY